MKVSFTVPGPPTAKGRPRISTAGPRPIAYTPSKTVNYEALVGFFASQAMEGQTPTENAVKMTMTAKMPIPRSWPGWKKDAAATEAMRHTSKPDLDNILKAATDAMNGIVYQDDSQICVVEQRKCYGMDPCVEIEVETVESVKSRKDWTNVEAMLAKIRNDITCAGGDP